MPSESPSLPYARIDGSGPPSQRAYARQPHKLAWHVHALSLFRRPTILLPTLAFCLVVALASHRTTSTAADGADYRADGASPYNEYRDRLHNSFDRIASSWRHGTARPDSEADREWVCNPFEANGRLRVDLADPRNTVWTPFDTRCSPSNLLKALYMPPGDLEPLIPAHSIDGTAAKSSSSREFLPWFRNRTIVLQGDSIDRFHLRDFCDFVRGRVEHITTDHPANPPMYLMPNADDDRREWEAKWAERPDDGQALTQPWVCDIEEYGTTIVNVFTWGLEGAEEFFRTERWYYPPARWIDRTNEITVPLLRLLAKHLDRPQIEHPDLIVVNSGYWDLRKYTEEDFVAAGHLHRPYPEDSPIPYTPLSAEREQTWEREARAALKHIARTFRGKEGKARNGPTLLWRTLHHPPRHNYAPFPRVFQLDSLARKVLSDLRASQDPLHSSSSSARSSASAPPLAPLSEPAEDEDLGLSHRLRIDDSGRIMLGQEHLFRDLLHPLPVPGSWVWGDVMLYELKRAVEGVDR